MKSISYLLIILFIGNIIASAFPLNGTTKNQLFTIQCIHQNHTPEELAESAGIIQSRLLMYGINNPEAFIDTTKGIIDFTIGNGQVKSEPLTSLATTKGELAFYELYDRSTFISETEIKSELRAILDIPPIHPNDPFSGVLGTCNEVNVDKVENLLQTYKRHKSAGDVSFFWSEEPNQKGDYELFLMRPKTRLNKSTISSASILNDSTYPGKALSINFTTKGEVLWSDFTKRNIGKSMAMVMDEKVLATPFVKLQITDGKCVLTGNFSPEKISRLSALINNEVLPLNFKVKK